MPEGNPYDPEWTEQDSDGDYFDEPTDDDLDNIEKDDSEFGDAMGEILSHYTAEQEEFNEVEQEFVDTYGFAHKCRCAQDWAEGNLGVVSVCYLGMIVDAMNTLEEMNKTTKELKRENAKLRIKSAE